MAKAKKELAVGLQASVCGCRFSASKFGLMKTFTNKQKKTTADVFSAGEDEITAKKRLIAKREKALMRVTRIISGAKAYWKSITVPFPEPGIRLIKKDAIAEFEEKMKGYSDRLKIAADALQASMDAIIEERKQSLGDLFAKGDYPESVASQYDIGWNYPSLTAPSYLEEVAPAVYAKEKARIEAQFTSAIAMTEQAMVVQLKELVEGFSAKLSRKSESTGKNVKLKDDAFQKLNDFIAKFKSFGLAGANEQLDALLKQADDLADSKMSAKDQLKKVSAEFAKVGESLEAMIVERPKRKMKLDD